MKKLIFILFFTLTKFLFAQDSLQKVFSFEEFFSLVKENHPLAMQANLQLEVGDAAVRASRGGFDPKAFASASQKYFDDKKYYSITEGGLRVPTWFGIEIEGGYDQNEGVFLNPQNNVPDAGLWFAGISVPLGKDLILDQRRKDLRKAQLFQENTEAMQKALINDLLLEASQVYWSWVSSYHQLIVFNEGFELADFRYNSVKQSADLGDLPPIDTVEAGIQVQNRMLSQQSALLNYQNMSAQLSAYLWADGLIPLELADNTIPPALNDIELSVVDPEINLYKDTLIANHPDLQIAQNKIDQLEVERRYRAQQLLPKIDLKYNPLLEPSNNGDILDNYSVNNYTWGIQFNMPIFIRSERGNLQRIKLEQQENQYSFDNKEQLLLFKLKASINDWNTSRQQAELYKITARDYERLLEGEQQLFNEGESSLFMVNSREIGFINAKVKLIELTTKNQIAKIKTYYAAGTLLNL